MNHIEQVMRYSKAILVAGHRGYSTLYPENTLQSFQEAIELGVDMIEFDLNLTRDKAVVVIHDKTVDRTTDGHGYVRGLSLRNIRKLDAGIRSGRAFSGLRIPTLDELCNLVQDYPQLLLNVEIKERTRETVDLTIDILRKYALLERCVFTCFDARIIHYIADEYQLLTQGFPAEYMSYFQDGPAGTYSRLFAVGISQRAFIDLIRNRRSLSRKITREFAEKQIWPWSYCPDDDKAVEKAIACGVRLVTANNPEPALRILKGKGLSRPVLGDAGFRSDSDQAVN